MISRDQLIVYILEASAIAIVGKVVIGKSPIDTSLFILIGMLAAANIVMDLYAPKISPSMRQGAGFGLGMKQVGGNPMLIAIQLKSLKKMVSDLQKAKEKGDTVQLTILPSSIKDYAKILAGRAVINNEINSKFVNLSKNTSVDELNTIIDMLDEKIGGDNRTPKEIYDAIPKPTARQVPKPTNMNGGLASRIAEFRKNNPPPPDLREGKDTLEIRQWKKKVLPKMIAFNEEALSTKDYMGRTKEQLEFGLETMKKDLQDVLAVEEETESEPEIESDKDNLRIPEPEELIKNTPEAPKLPTSDLNTLRECKRFLNSGLHVRDFTESQVNTLFECRKILQSL